MVHAFTLAGGRASYNCCLRMDKRFAERAAGRSLVSACGGPPTVVLPHRVPFDFHGNWLGAKAIESRAAAPAVRR